MTPTKKAQARENDGKATTRDPLTRERVVACALSIVDEQGLDALTMRGLGRECGYDPMTLYRHVRDKEELLDALSEAIWDEIEIPEDGFPGTWQEQFRAAFTLFRDTLRSHVNALPVMFRHGAIGDAAIARTEFALGILMDAGFDPHDAMWALDTTSCYVLGWLIGEAGQPEARTTPEQALEIYSKLSPSAFPNFAKVMGAGQPADHSESFERGMDLIIRGLEGLLLKAR